MPRPQVRGIPGDLARANDFALQKPEGQPMVNQESFRGAQNLPEFAPRSLPGSGDAYFRMTIVCRN
jgi:hypothetical protein